MLDIGCSDDLGDLGGVSPLCLLLLLVFLRLVSSFGSSGNDSPSAAVWLNRAILDSLAVFSGLLLLNSSDMMVDE